MLFGLVLLHAVCGTVALVGARRLGRRALIVGAAAPLAVVVWAISNASGILDGHAVATSTEWVPSLGLAVDLRVDSFTLLMIALVSGIGALVLGYSWYYFGASDNSDSSDGVRVGKVAGLLTLFAGAMLGVVLADNLLVLYVFWELTSITSYLLIGVDDSKAEARSAAQHALMVTGLGGLVMLAGLVLVGQQAGTFQLSAILADPPSGGVTSAALVLVLIGAFTKSAQYPFHSWLPAAMVAPTPISAYLHSAAMVKAGIYLVARLAPTFADMGIWRPLVVSIGLLTMIAGGLRAQRPFDLKQLLAFGTISQLGFMMVLFGIGLPEATAAGCALILAHGLFKAALFMVVGIVDHEANTRDIRELPQFGPGWTTTKVVAFLSAASMAGIPPLAGFIAKEQAYGALVEGTSVERLVLAGIVLGSMLTVAYSLRFCVALIRPNMVSDEPVDRPPLKHQPAFGFVAPAALLAFGSVSLGVVPRLWSGFVDHAANALDPSAHAHLLLWHGFTPALILSMFTLAAGIGLFLARWPFGVVQARLAPPVSGETVYEVIVREILHFARRLTGVVQSGSLPVYGAVILGTAAVAPTVALLRGNWWPGWPDMVGRPGHVPIALMLVIGAVAATVARRRFSAVILLGVVGYAMAVLFAVQGAPDLALTQFGVETLFVVVFLLVMRQLPDRFDERPTVGGRALRLGVSAAVGVFVVLMALASAGSRTVEPVSRLMSKLAYPQGDGKNIVNVILVDIRGLDTLGEISVLVAAGIGIVALARVGQSPRPRPPSRSARREERSSAPNLPALGKPASKVAPANKVAEQ
ncbi:MAG TPA: hydrogen gas-evolving membrane-bound hydrogenase subunit E [Microthrixaceae bacterium]|nr:hydrogen gas-evolving membrane-bound hydrogenase subunit E [Microthrixaceae bacterium]